MNKKYYIFIFLFSFGFLQNLKSMEFEKAPTRRPTPEVPQAEREMSNRYFVKNETGYPLLIQNYMPTASLFMMLVSPTDAALEAAFGPRAGAGVYLPITIIPNGKIFDITPYLNFKSKTSRIKFNLLSENNVLKSSGKYSGSELKSLKFNRLRSPLVIEPLAMDISDDLFGKTDIILPIKFSSLKGLYLDEPIYPGIISSMQEPQFEEHLIKEISEEKPEAVWFGEFKESNIIPEYSRSESEKTE